MHRVASVLRDIVRGALAALLAGSVVGGLGGRVVMSIAAVLNPDAAGLRTENGELIGRFTIEGTLALVLFGGLGAGLLGAVMWVVIDPWLPARGARRIVLASVAAVGLSSFLLIKGTNPDFLLLHPRAFTLALLVLLVLLCGAITALLDRTLERHLPRSKERPAQDVAAYGLFMVPGVLVFVLVLIVFFGPDSVNTTPVGVGPALVIVGLATAATWVLRSRSDAPQIPMAVTWAGRLGLVAAVVLGLVHLAAQASRIVALG
jgi:diacylglycerol kinase